MITLLKRRHCLWFTAFVCFLCVGEEVNYSVSSILFDSRWMCQKVLIKSINCVGETFFLQNHWILLFLCIFLLAVKKVIQQICLIVSFYAFKHTLKSPLHYNKNLFLRHIQRLYLLCYKRWISFFSSTHKFAKRYDKILNVGMTWECVYFNIMLDFLSSVKRYTQERERKQGKIHGWRFAKPFLIEKLEKWQSWKSGSADKNQDEISCRLLNR